MRTAQSSAVSFALSLVALIAVIPAHGSTQDKEWEAIKWRFSHFLPANHSLAKSFTDWAQKLQRTTGNRLNISIYPASQLGSGTDQYDIARTRVAHIAWIVPGYEQGRFPIFSLLELPLLIRDASAGARSFHEWYGQYAELEMKEVYPCQYTTSPPSRLSFKDQPAMLPEQLRGKRVRVPNATVGRFVRSLGGVTINIPVSEVRHALERGMIDAVPFDIYSSQNMSLERILINHLDVPFSSGPAILGINRRALQSLPDDVRPKVIDYCSPARSAELVANWQQLELRALEKARTDPAHHFHQLSPEEVQNWLDKTQPLVAEWLELAGRKGLQRPSQALDEFQRILQRNVAAFSIEDQEIQTPGDHNEK